MELFRKLFPKAAQLVDAEQRIEVLEVERDELKDKLEHLWASYNSHDATVQKQREEIAELKAKVRAQNEADLLMVSLQIVQRLLAGEKKESPSMSMALAQQQALSQNFYAGSYMQSGGLGLAGLLGGMGGIWRQ